MRRFVKKHQLSCFICRLSGTYVEWAKTGTSSRGPWALCTSCIEHKRT